MEIDATSLPGLSSLNSSSESLGRGLVFLVVTGASQQAF
jgi:hypothetical protein